MKNYLLRTFHFPYDPIALLPLLRDEPFVCFLDSMLHHSERGRFSYIGVDPFYVFQSRGKNSIAALKKAFEQYLYDPEAQCVPFQAGLMGYVAYEYGFNLEDINHREKEQFLLPDCCFGFYDCVVIIDHCTRTLTVSSSGLPERDPRLRSHRARQRLNRLCKKFVDLNAGRMPRMRNDSFKPSLEHGLFTSNFTKQEYCDAVSQALEYIRQGDIYEVNLSQRFVCDTSQHGNIDPLTLYGSLRQRAPTHFSAFMDCGSFQIMSSSPERFLKSEGGIISTRPMKGTRPRGRTANDDTRLRTALIGSHKDAAELMMITDLMRNDLGKVCDFGSVHVPEMRSLEEYSSVFQMTSTVVGRLAEGRDCFDALAACFPGGSITGCPKIRSMEIIDELEPTRRFVYTGSLGYISSAGDMDFNILIRTAVLHQRQLYYYAGGGIVADSDPEGEYEETLVKAGAFAAAVEDVVRQKKETSDCEKGSNGQEKEYLVL